MSPVRRLLAASALALAVPLLTVGCGSESADQADDDSSSTPSSPESSMSTNPSDPSEDTSVEAKPGAGSTVVQAAIADLAEREGVEAAEIEFLALEEVTWRNGSLGCAQPGMMYTQALVAGQRVVLRLNGQDYEYHSAGKKPGTWCKNPTE